MKELLRCAHCGRRLTHTRVGAPCSDCGQYTCSFSCDGKHYVEELSKRGLKDLALVPIAFPTNSDECWLALYLRSCFSVLYGYETADYVVNRCVYGG